MVAQSTTVVEQNVVRDPKTMPLEAQVDISDIVVFDFGSGRSKVGIAGQDTACVVFPSVLKEVGGPSVDQLDGSQILRVAVGDDARKDQDNSWIPFDRDDVNHVEHFIRHGLRQLGESGFAVGEVHALFVESPGVTLAKRQLIVSKIFQAFQNVKSIAVINSAVLGLFSTGRTRGLVVEAGHASTFAVPVFEGFAIPHATFGTPNAGSILANKMRELYKEHELGGFDGLGIDDFHAMVERCCWVRPLPSSVVQFVVVLFDGLASSQAASRDQLLSAAADICDIEEFPPEICKMTSRFVSEWLNVVENEDGPPSDMLSFAQHVISKFNNSTEVDEDKQRFESPDGRVVDLSIIGAEVAEVLFESSSDLSITDVVFSAIAACDHELQMDIVKHTVIVGGTSFVPGFSSRLKMELEIRIWQQARESSDRALHPDLSRVEMEMCVDSSRKEAAWIGGSMFGSLSTCSHFAVSREDLETSGRLDINPEFAAKAI